MTIQYGYIPFFLNPFVGDAGNGGQEGLVPAPAAGDGAAGKFLAANGNWAVPSGTGGGVTTIGALDGGTPSANGLSISSVTLFAQSASPTQPGLMTTANQVFAGQKKFNNQIQIVSAGNYLSLGASNPQVITSTSTTGTRTFTLPNADSNPIRPLGSATASNWVQYIDADGVQNLAQPAFSNISGAVNLVSQVTGILPISNGGTALSSGPTNGQLLIGNAGVYALGTLTQGTGITVTNAAGSITVGISASYVGQTSITTLGTIGTGTWQGTIVGPTYGGTGVNNGALTITLASGTTGKVLASDSSGNATWQALSGLGVTSAQGTANEILINGLTTVQTGVCLFTTPQAIGTTSSVTFGNVTDSALTLGSIVFAGTAGILANNNAQLFWDSTNNLLGIGNATPISGGGSKVRIDASSSTIGRGLYVTGTQSLGSGLPMGIHCDMTFSPTVGTTVTVINSDPVFAAAAATQISAICFQASPAYAGNAGTVVGYGYFYDGGAAAVGTVTYNWGAYFKDPVAGSTAKMGLYADSFMIGSGYDLVTPPAGGGAIKGKLGINTSAPLSFLDVGGNMVIGGTYAGTNAAPTNGMLVQGQSIFKGTSSLISASVEIQGSDRISLFLGGTKTSTDGTLQYAVYNDITFSPSSSTTTCAAYAANPSFAPGTGVVITTGYAHYLRAGSQSGLGSVTTGINLYAENPAFGTTKWAIYANGAVRVPTLQVSTSPTSGYVLTSDASGNATWQPTGAGGSSVLNLAITAVKTSTYTVLTTDCIIQVSTTGGVVNINMPLTAAAGQVWYVMDIGGFASTNNIVINAQVPGAINAGLSYNMTTNYGIAIVTSRASLAGTQTYVASQTK